MDAVSGDFLVLIRSVYHPPSSDNLHFWKGGSVLA